METTKEERDEMRRRRGRTPDHVWRRVLNDADRLAQAERQRDEARWLLRRCRVQIDTEGGADELVDEINAHLRDTEKADGS